MVKIKLKNPFKENKEKQIAKLEKKQKSDQLIQCAKLNMNNDKSKSENFTSKINIFEQIDDENIIKAECDIDVNPVTKELTKNNCNYKLLKIVKECKEENIQTQTIENSDKDN